MINIVIPMAGNGKRFKDAGYKDPKPFIDVLGKKMIEVVVQNIMPSKHDYRFIFVAQQEHLLNGGKDILEFVTMGCTIVPLYSSTRGAACTVLMAAEHIDNRDPLLIANCDQLMDFNIDQFLTQAREYDGLIATMEATGDKWSYVKMDDRGYVTQVAEKKQISNVATCGLYYFGHGATFCSAVRKMIAEFDTHAGEYYVAPVYNHIFKKFPLVRTYKVNKMWGLGTPEDLESFKIDTGYQSSSCNVALNFPAK